MTVTLTARQERVAASGYTPALTHQVKRCPVCRETSRYVLANRDRYGFPAMFMRCRQCGLIYLAPRLSDEAYREFYAEHYRDVLAQWYGYAWTGNKLQSDQQAYTDAVLSGLLKVLSGREGQTAIDIGGSAGVFAAALRDTLGINCEVIDPNGEEINLAREKGLTASVGNVEDIPAWQQFDLVFLMQTIEHLTDPLGAFRKVCGQLKAGGLFVFDFVPFEMKSVAPEVLLKIDHPCTFTSYAAHWLVEAAGLRLVSMHGLTGRQFHFVCEKSS